MGRQGWPAFKEEEATVNVETLQRMAVVVETYDPLCEDEWIQVRERRERVDKRGEARR